MIIIMMIIACSRRSDRGDSAKRCGVGERARESRSLLSPSSSSSFPPYFFSRSLPSLCTPLSERLEQAMIISNINNDNNNDNIYYNNSM